MTVKMNIDSTPVAKALVRSADNSFELRDVTPIVERDQVQPRLLTAMLMSSVDPVLLETHKFNYDELNHTLQLPEGKAYNEYGARLNKDLAKEKTFSIGSFGMSGNVDVQDYIGKRIPGTEDLMDEAYLVAQMNTRMQKSWALFDELSLVQLVTTDTNITRGNPIVPSYNFYTDIVGSARPAAQDMDLGNTALDHDQAFATEAEKMQEELEKTMNSSTALVMICGESFFNKRLLIEKRIGLGGGYDLGRSFVQGRLDLATLGVPTDNLQGTGIFQNQNFEAADGITYVKYTSSILGSRLISNDDAFLVPVGADNMLRMVYAPAHTKEYANRTAMTQYGWSTEDERGNIHMWTEKNVLPFNANPQLIRHYTTTT